MAKFTDITGFEHSDRSENPNVKEFPQIDIQFSYDMPDKYLYQTTNKGLVGTHNYRGPDHLWVFMDKVTNKRSGSPGPWGIEDDYVPPAHTYKVLIYCVENPLLCELFEPDIDLLLIEGREQTIEDLPVINSVTSKPFQHIQPKVPTPDHTYEVTDIEFNPTGHDPKTGTGGTWITPFPFKKPHVSWYSLKCTRHSRLMACDHKIQDDTPAALKKAWEDYRQELRVLPETYGVAFTVEVTAQGSGYKVDDKFVVDKSVFGFSDDDLGTPDDISQPMGWRPGFDHYDMSNVHTGSPEGTESGDNPTSPEGIINEGSFGPLGLTEKPTLDVTIIVTSVTATGKISGVRTRNAFNARHIFEAQTHTDVANTATTDAGTGAKFKLSKVVRWDPWKCRLPLAPDDPPAQFEGQIGRYKTEAERNDPSDGHIMDNIYDPVQGCFIPPELGGNYMAKDLTRLNLSTDGTSFDDGDVDGLAAAPASPAGKTRVAGTVTARKQSS